ncbi:MAG TPA: FMN-binding protein [Candidatus Nanopelagicaceae bacterium]
MKRALLIAGGTIGGIGAVLSITPPQLGSQGMTGLGLGKGATAHASVAANTTTSQSPTAAVPQSATSVAATTAATPASSATPVTKKKTTKKRSTKTQVASAKVTPTPATTHTKTVAPTPTQTKTVAPTPTHTKTVAPAPTPTKTVAPAPTPVSKGVSGTFTGSAINVNYGTVQVQITVSNGKITDAQAIQAPSGRSGQFSTYALPILRQETLAAQSSQIQGVSGASYTSYGWYTSLVAALAKAGM